jgi:hypothetical protein
VRVARRVGPVPTSGRACAVILDWASVRECPLSERAHRRTGTRMGRETWEVEDARTSARAARVGLVRGLGVPRSSGHSRLGLAWATSTRARPRSGRVPLDSAASSSFGFRRARWRGRTSPIRHMGAAGRPRNDVLAHGDRGWLRSASQSAAVAPRRCDASRCWGHRARASGLSRLC